MHIVKREKIKIISNRNEAMTPGRTEIGVFYLKRKTGKQKWAGGWRRGRLVVERWELGPTSKAYLLGTGLLDHREGGKEGKGGERRRERRERKI